MKSKEKFLTLEILRENEECKNRYSHLVEKLGKNWADDQPLTLSKILEVNGIEYCLRAFKCFDLPLANDLKRIAVKTAVFAAKKVLPLWTDVFPNDDRPAKAIEAAEDYLANPTVVAAAYAAFAAEKAAEAVSVAPTYMVIYSVFYWVASACADPYISYVPYAAILYPVESSVDSANEIKRYLQELLIELSL